jgi:hypothetical protein
MRGSDKEVPERDAGYLRALRSFEASQGRILSAFWGSNLPIGVALTETRASRVKRWLGAAPGVNLHRSVDGIDLPAEVEAALADGDLLALKASGVLRDPSRRVVLERVMSAQRYFLSIIDSSRGDMPRPADIREKAATP